jgi:hypothetical protein
MYRKIWHEDSVSAIVRQCRRFLIERETGQSPAYQWLRESWPFMDVVRHFQASGLTLFQIAAIVAYSDIHPQGAEALEILQASIEAEESGCGNQK